jgi:hypothetical protein
MAGRQTEEARSGAQSKVAVAYARKGQQDQEGKSETEEFSRRASSALRWD